MPQATIKHDSTQTGGLSQLDSVFAQMRAKAQSSKWELVVDSSGDATRLALVIANDPPMSKADVLRKAADAEDKRVADEKEKLEKSLAELPK